MDLAFYNNIGEFLLSLLIWWGVLFLFQRISNRSLEGNSLKKDIAVTFVQSLILLFILNALRIYTDLY